MNSAQLRAPDAGRPVARAEGEPTTRQMLALWVPLAASLVMMVLEPSIVNVGLGRTIGPELALAAYGVAMNLAFLIEAPILMLLDASVARSSNRAAFVLVRRFALGLGLTVAAIGLVVSLTPLYDLLVRNLMDIPADVAARAQPTLQILSLWPLPIAWRRAHQGVLIRAGRTAVITVATGVRLTVLSAGLFGGLLLVPHRGALIAGVAMDVSVIAEAALITWATRAVLRAPSFQANSTGDGESPLTLRHLWRFYRPLAFTTILRQTSRPILSAGIAAAMLPRASLAAWPVAWGLVILITGPAMSLQQLTTALAVNPSAYRRVRRFSLGLSVLFSAVLALVVFTPLYGLVMGGIYNLPSDLQDLARPATQLMALIPLIMGAQSLLRGALIRAGRTADVRTAVTAAVSVLAATLVLGVSLLSPDGVFLAAGASLTGALAELAWLAHKARF